MSVLRAIGAFLLVILGTANFAVGQQPSQRLIEIQFMPTKRAQIALWMEKEDGTFLRTLRLTSSVAYWGIGNRPGAAQMNSGFRWPYGRRESVLPVWALRRSLAPGAAQFKRVIFQNRTSEGFASRTSDDNSRDDHFCLSFNNQNNLELDAMSCATVFYSDKGRYITLFDLEIGYAEPFEDPGQAGNGRMRALSLESLYPPRRDVARCTTDGCYDTVDVDDYAQHARTVMPEIDEITMATPAEANLQKVLFSLPLDWTDASYVVWLEINTEADTNSCFTDEAYPTPTSPDSKWDTWALNYGYPYRGQPSVVYKLPITFLEGAHYSTLDPEGRSSWEAEPHYLPLDSCVSNDAFMTPGSGADRLLVQPENWRLKTTITSVAECDTSPVPSPVSELVATPFSEKKHSHEWAHLRFLAANDDMNIFEYQVRVATTPITDETSFLQARPANAATLEIEGISVPADVPANEPIEVDIGGLIAQTRYFVAVRAIDPCNRPGPIQTTEIETTAIHFTTVEPCFIATAAYGSPLDSRIDALRYVRNRYLMHSAWGRSLVRFYYWLSPPIAKTIAQSDFLRTLTRVFLTPFVTLASFIQTHDS